MCSYTLPQAYIATALAIAPRFIVQASHGERAISFEPVASLYGRDGPADSLLENQ